MEYALKQKRHLQSRMGTGAVPSEISRVSFMVDVGCVHGLVSCSTTIVACAEEGVHQSKLVCTKATFVLATCLTGPVPHVSCCEPANTIKSPACILNAPFNGGTHDAMSTKIGEQLWFMTGFTS